MIEFCGLLELKRHHNNHVIVHVVADEATSFRVSGLQTLLTWARAAGLKIHLAFQTFPEFRRAYGKDAQQTLQSETDIKLFLPGQSEPETLDMIEKMLGNGSYVAVGRNGNAEANDFLIGGTSYQEDARPLLTADEIRRTDKGILFLRNNKPALVDLPFYAECKPYRSQIDINPYHGKPFMMPVKYRFKHGQNGKLSKLLHIFHNLFKRRKRELREQKNRLLRLAGLARFISVCFRIWPVFVIAAFFVSTSSPHVLVDYQYRQHRNGARSYISCTYFGARGFVTPYDAGDCPWFVFLDSERRR